MSDEQIDIAIAEACGWTYFSCNIPNYCNDLNAMHEAEEKLTNEQLDFYCNILHKPNHGIYWAIHATARQRAEAFLRTIGKWEE